MSKFSRRTGVMINGLTMAWYSNEGGRQVTRWQLRQTSAALHAVRLSSWVSSCTHSIAGSSDTERMARTDCAQDECKSESLIINAPPCTSALTVAEKPWRTGKKEKGKTG